MGILDLFKFKGRPDYLAEGSGGTSAYLSPYAADTLAPAIIWSDWLSSDEALNLPLTRMAALQVPSVAKTRNVLISTIGPLPLRVLNSGGLLPAQPSWTSRTDTAKTPYQRTAEVVTDLFFDGWSALAVKRGSKGQALQLAHIPKDRLGSDSKGKLTVDGQPVPEEQVCVIESPYEGILNIGSPTIRGARDLELAWHGRSRNPIPLVVISHNNQDTQSGGLEPHEIQSMKEGYSASRRDVNGALAYLPPGLKAEALGTAEADLFEKGRNAATTAIGQLANVRASMIDGTLADSSSLTYMTKEGERSAFLTFDLPFYTRVIEERLSLDDIVPAGQYVRFDMTELLTNPPAATGSPSED
jgi:hypothetical protein